MVAWFYVALGGFLGANSRYLVGRWAKKKESDIPIGTLFVNLTGSFLLGYLISSSFDGYWYSLFGVGFLGAFTTFSTMNVEAVQLFMQKKTSATFIYIVLTYTAGISLAFLGFFLSTI